MEGTLSRDEKRWRHPCRSHFELESQLREIRKTHGPIYGMEIFGHGGSGSMEFPSDESVASPGRIGSYAEIFELNAKIKLTSCDVGNGARGEEFVTRVGNTFLAEGGVVYSSKVIIRSRLFSSLRSSKLGVPQSVNSKIERMSSYWPAMPLTVELRVLWHLLNDERFPSDPIRKTIISPLKNKVQR